MLIGGHGSDPWLCLEPSGSHMPGGSSFIALALTAVETRVACVGAIASCLLTDMLDNLAKYLPWLV
jgi:hypothetical protein